MLRRLQGYPGRYYDREAFLLTVGRNALILIRMAGLAVTAAAAIGLKFKFPAAAVARIRVLSDGGLKDRRRSRGRATPVIFFAVKSDLLQ